MTRLALASLAPIFPLGLLLGACSTDVTDAANPKVVLRAAQVATGAASGQTGAIDVGPAIRLGAHIEDAHRGGRGTAFELLEVRYGRMVELWAEAADGHQVRIAEDFVIGESFTGDGIRAYLLEQPVLGVSRLHIAANVEDLQPGGGRDQVLRVAAAAADSAAVLNDAGATGRGLMSRVPRNAGLSLRFNDLVDAGGLAAAAPRILVGSPALHEHPVRVVTDALHGGIDSFSGEFQSTRVLVDLAVREQEAARAVGAHALSPLGLPAAQGLEPSAVLRLPTVAAIPGSVLTNLGGVGLGAGAGSVDASSVGKDIVRPFLAGSGTGVTKGFLGDIEPPRLVARADVELPFAPQQFAPASDLFTLPQVRFMSPGCAATAQPGDIIVQPDLVAEVISTSTAPAGLSIDLVVVRLLSFPSSWTGPDEWQTMGAGPARYDAVFDPAMDLARVACLVGVTPDPVGAPQAPTRGVAPDASFTLWFNEPIDPESLTGLDGALIGRSPLPAGGQVPARDVAAAAVTLGSDFESVSFTPIVPLAHTAGTSETGWITPRLGVGAVRDAAGNSLLESPGPIAFAIRDDAPTVDANSLLLRLEGNDELGTGGPDLSGQIQRVGLLQSIQPRPVVRFTGHVDSTQAVISQMTSFGPGLQTPMNPLGARMQTSWRYVDMGLGLTDLATVNIDVEGLAWAPAGGTVIADQFAEFEIGLAHSRFAQDEVIDPASLFPRFQNSGMRSGFALNVLDPLGTTTVHPRASGFSISPGELSVTPTGTVVHPFPLNVGVPQGDLSYYTWRDTRRRERAGFSSGGVEPQALAQALGQPSATVAFYRAGEVQTVGLPLLMDFSTWPDSGAVGLNAARIALAVNSSSRPYFRAFSAGGVTAAGAIVQVDPAAETEANGGFSTGVFPPPGATFGRDNSVYLGAADFVVRVSVAHTHWFSVGGDGPSRTFAQPLVGAADTAGSVVVDVRGASAIQLQVAAPGNEAQHNDINGNNVVDYLESAAGIDPYGDFYNDVTVSFLNHDSSAANPGLTFLGANDAWQADVAAIQGARFVQMRLTMTSDAVTGERPMVESLGLGWRD